MKKLIVAIALGMIMISCANRQIAKSMPLPTDTLQFDSTKRMTIMEYRQDRMYAEMQREHKKNKFSRGMHYLATLFSIAFTVYKTSK